MTILDLVAIENFIVRIIVKAIDLPRKNKEELYILRLIDELVLEKEVSKETILLSIFI